MTAPTNPKAALHVSDTVITADCRTDPRELFYAATGMRRLTEAEKAEQAERSQAWRECERKMLANPKRYDPEYDDQCRAEYAERLRQITAKYAEPILDLETRHLGDDRWGVAA